MLKKIRYILEAIAVYIIYGFFQKFSPETASNIGGWLGKKIGPKIGASKKANKNLILAMPELTEAERKKIILKMWENLGRVIAEYPHLKKLGAKTEIINKELLDEIAKSNKPAIFVSGHLANWEMLAASATVQSGLNINLTYRKPNNPFVDDFLKNIRNIGVAGHIAKSRKSAIKMAKIIKSGGKIGILNDQKLNEGIRVLFFRQYAMTSPIVAQLSIKFNCPVYPVKIERIKGTKFRMTIMPDLKIYKLEEKSKEKTIQNATANINLMLEEWIRKAPAQWLWIHNRWP